MLTKKLNLLFSDPLVEHGSIRQKADNMNIPGVPRHDHVQHFPVSQEALEQMQHDIRSPLGVILGISDLMSATASTPEQVKMATILKSSSENLKTHIDALFEAL